MTTTRNDFNTRPGVKVFRVTDGDCAVIMRGTDGSNSRIAIFTQPDSSDETDLPRHAATWCVLEDDDLVALRDALNNIITQKSIS